MTQRPKDEANPYENAGRTAKAVALMFTIDRAFAQSDVNPTTDGALIADHIVDLADDGWWERMAAASDVHPPSKATQDMVVALYRKRAERPSNDLIDPWKGL